jgi:hypothetical protein
VISDAILRESGGNALAPVLLLTFGMSDLSDRLCVGLVLLGVMILLSLFGHVWLPLSASYDMPTYERSRPALPDWPHQPHHGGIEYRA